MTRVGRTMDVVMRPIEVAAVCRRVFRNEG